jgi:hypothetical protein
MGVKNIINTLILKISVKMKKKNVTQTLTLALPSECLLSKEAIATSAFHYNIFLISSAYSLSASTTLKE